MSTESFANVREKVVKTEAEILSGGANSIIPGQVWVASDTKKMIKREMDGSFSFVKADGSGSVGASGSIQVAGVAAGSFADSGLNVPAVGVIQNNISNDTKLHLGEGGSPEVAMSINGTKRFKSDSTSSAVVSPNGSKVLEITNSAVNSPFPITQPDATLVNQSATLGQVNSAVTGKQDTVSATSPIVKTVNVLSHLNDATTRHVTDTEKATWNNKADMSAVNAKVRDQIQDGVTSSAPSENAVFDSLGNKSTLGDILFTPSAEDSSAKPKIRTVLPALGSLNWNQAIVEIADASSDFGARVTFGYSGSVMEFQASGTSGVVKNLTFQRTNKNETAYIVSYTRGGAQKWGIFLDATATSGGATLKLENVNAMFTEPLLVDKSTCTITQSFVQGTQVGELLLDATGKTGTDAVLSIMKGSTRIGSIRGDGFLEFLKATFAQVSAGVAEVTNKLLASYRLWVGGDSVDHSALLDIQDAPSISGILFNTNIPHPVEGVYTLDGTFNGKSKYTDGTYFMFYASVSGSDYWFVHTSTIADGTVAYTTALMRTGLPSATAESSAWVGADSSMWGYTGSSVAQGTGLKGLSVGTMEVRTNITVPVADADNEPTQKLYVDTGLAGKVSKTGDTVTGKLEFTNQGSATQINDTRSIADYTLFRTSHGWKYGSSLAGSVSMFVDQNEWMGFGETIWGVNINGVDAIKLKALNLLSQSSTAQKIGGGIKAIIDIDFYNTEIVSKTSVTQQNVAGAVRFASGNMRLKNPAGTFTYSIVGSAITADRNVTIPLVTGNDTFAMLALGQAYTGNNSYSGTQTLSNTRGVALTGAGVVTTNGDFGHDTTQKKHVCFSDGIKGWVTRGIMGQYSVVTNTNPITAGVSMLTGSKVGTVTLPANFWAAGKRIIVELNALLTNQTGSSQASILELKYGGTSLASINYSCPATSSTSCVVRAEISCITTSTANISLSVIPNVALGAVSHSQAITLSTVTGAIDFTGYFSTGNASNSMICYSAKIIEEF